MAYSRLLRRKIRSPYLDIINAEVPYARQGLQLKKGRELAERMANERSALTRERSALTREGMAIQEKEAKKAFQIGVAQTGLMGGYLGHSLLKKSPAIPATTTTFPALPTSLAAGSAPATGLGAGGAGMVSEFPLLAGAKPLYPGAEVVYAGGEGVTAGSGATKTAGGAATGGSWLTTPAVGAKTSPLGAAGGVLAIEAGHKMLKPMIPKIAENMPGGENEWKHGMKIGTRAGQGAVIGSAIPIVGPQAGAVAGAVVGTVETAWPAIKTAAEDVWDEAERTFDKGVDIVEDVWDFISDPCIIITAATDPYSYEVNVTREYRDRYLSQQTLRGYYMVAEKVVPLMHKSKRFKLFVKKHLVDHIVRHCEWGIGLRKKKPVRSSFTTTTFLSFCDFIGSTVPAFVRNNGEVW